MFEKNNAEVNRRVRAVLEPALVPGEQLRGAIHATKKSAFSGKVFAVGLADDRLILVELDRKFEAKGPPVTVRREDITKASIDGWGGGFGHFMAADAPEIRFDTDDDKYKLLVVGGMTGEKLMGEDYSRGLEAICEFIASAN
jgi:hypothetical protein